MTTWRPIVGYEGRYEVSDAGEVRRVSGGCGARPGRILATHRDRYGYERVHLSRDCDGQDFKVHILVAAAFIGPRPESFDINHIDGVRHNNHRSNLEYLSRRDNVRDALRRSGWRGRGINHPSPA